MTENQTKAILAGLDTGEYDAESSMDELEELALTAGAQTVARIIQKRPSPDTATVLGEGKIAELRELCIAFENELVVFDCELSASQIRNIERRLNEKTATPNSCSQDGTDDVGHTGTGTVRVIDRTMLILDIFAGRAVSREGKLQVELAQLKYRLPRLSGLGVALSRLGGGIGTRGPGETQLETDRRHIRRKIERLTDELKELETRRNFSRSRRKKDGTQTAAIVGYTNAGKSTLLNSLTNADVLAEDKLFATLDPISRAITLPDGRNLLLIDTVGLIRRLPHHLVQAFKSTLEEAANADIILHVQDVSDPEHDEKAEVTARILAELGAIDIPIVNILNKCDCLEFNEFNEFNEFSEERKYADEGSPTVCVSAKNGTGFEEMLKAIAENLPASSKRMVLLLPFDKAALAAKIRVNGKIFAEEYTESGLQLDALVEEKLIKEMTSYQVC
jgi:GTP-binding protein HflX